MPRQPGSPRSRRASERKCPGLKVHRGSGCGSVCRALSGGRHCLISRCAGKPWQVGTVWITTNDGLCRAALYLLAISTAGSRAPSALVPSELSAGLRLKRAPLDVVPAHSLLDLLHKHTSDAEVGCARPGRCKTGLCNTRPSSGCDSCSEDRVADHLSGASADGVGSPLGGGRLGGASILGLRRADEGMSGRGANGPGLSDGAG